MLVELELAASRQVRRQAKTFHSDGKEETMTDTIPQTFLHLTKSYPKPDMLLHKREGRYVPISTEEFRNRVSRLTLGLQHLGVKPGDKVILLADNGPDWTITDYAVLCLGGITVPIYTSSVPEQIKYIINDSDAKVVITSGQKLWEKVEAVKKDLPQVSHFLTFEPQAPEGIWPLSQIQERGEITPTLKVKRNIIEEKYKTLIDFLYRE